MKTKMSDRQYCTKCGGHLMNNHPPLGLVDVFAATIPTLPFTPTVHINYAETVLPMPPHGRGPQRLYGHRSDRWFSWAASARATCWMPWAGAAAWRCSRLA